VKRPIKKPSLPQTAIKMAFQQDILNLRLDLIMPTKTITPMIKESINFKRILTSVKAVGVIEPLVVAPADQASKRYVLLDGHIRLEALKDIGEKETHCLVSTDDESFTYNKYINRLSPVMEHKMIVKAVERGVSEERIARALNLNVANIIRKRTLLDGICREAIDLLKDKMVAGHVSTILRRMKDMRQVEAALLMNDANLYSTSYARALLVATPRDLLVNPDASKKVKGLNAEQIARMESEMESLQREHRLIEESFAPDVYNLTLTQAWLVKLIRNPRIERYLTQNHVEVLSQFQKITEMKSFNVKDSA